MADGETFKIRGDLGSMLSKKMRFEINRCDNETRRANGLSDCATSEEIDEYVKDVQIDTWNMFEKINYGDYVGKPVYRVQDILGSYMINPGKVDNLVLYFRQHYIET